MPDISVMIEYLLGPARAIGGATMADEMGPATLDETDISQEKAWYYAECARATIANLEKRYFNAYFAPTRRESLSLIMGMIPEGAKVGLGDSITLHQVGVIAELKRRNRNVVLDPPSVGWAGGSLLDEDARLEMMRQIFFADVFLLGQTLSLAMARSSTWTVKAIVWRPPYSVLPRSSLSPASTSLSATRRKRGAASDKWQGL